MRLECAGTGGDEIFRKRDIVSGIRSGASCLPKLIEFYEVGWCWNWGGMSPLQTGGL